MTRLALSFATRVNERVRPLVDGTVRPDGIDLVPTISHPGETFWRQLRFGDFDISEMSLSSFLIARSQGSDLVAIPAFPSRRFFHIELDARRDANIATPADLAGKRIGVPEYQQTAALWLRGILEHDFGVHPTSIRWFMERGETLSHGGATGFQPPAGISLEHIPEDESLVSMILGGKLDAALVRPNRTVGADNVIERSQRFQGSGDFSQLTPAFGDGITEGRRFFDAHGFIPINHTYVIRGELLRRHPWVALNVYKAFLEAKRVAERDPLEDVPLGLVFRWEFMDQVRRWFGPDPFPYGVTANRAVLERIVQFSHEQGLIPEPLDVESLFAPSTLAWDAPG
ncbi:MAG TPA: ABC transporter substrate-binding protein [Candidatus Limnocylindrales bacterium]|nr:ABC transporter substrate-binding protein [Candidatus Limnocylindrales bacterium]